VDEQLRGRVRDDLQGFFKGELLFDDLTRALYSTDASIFQVTPAGVVRPRDEEDLQALVRYAHQNNIPLIARGAGTGVSGEALGTGLIVDLSQRFRSIVEVGTDTVRVQPGVTYADLNRRLAAIGRRFAPDTASGKVCTIGGMLATDASGAHALKYGYTHDHVASLRAVLDNGDVVQVACEPVPQPGDQATGHLHDILMALAVVLEPNQELIRTTRPQTRFDRCGYRLDGVLQGGTINLPRLLVGSEGTLALFTEATLRTVPIPAGRAVVLLGFARVEDALRATQVALPTGPAACELMDRRLLSLARGSDASRVAALVSPAAEAVLLIEYEADSPAEAQQRADDLAQQLLKAERPALYATAASDEKTYEQLWQLRDVALPSLYGLKGGAQPIPFVEDIGVPVPALQDFLRGAQEILQEHETTASFLIHAGTGQVHTRPFLDLLRPEDTSKLWALSDRIHRLALELGGTVSTQHGTGLARTPWVARQAGALYPIYRAVKSVFDPKNLFNPGKIVDPDPTLAPWPLRTMARPATPPLPAQLLWQADELSIEANHCNGCGMCRDDAPEQRMCPIFRASADERATPRAKANLIRVLLGSNGDGRQLSSDEAREVADLCVNCKMCALECPAHINIPKMMLEAKAANVAAHGLDSSGWFFAHLQGLLRWASMLSFLSNLGLRSRAGRWLLDRIFGLSPRRRLPRFASRTFLSRAQRNGWTQHGGSDRPRVAYFVDVYANYFEPQIAEASVAVLRHNGFEVIVPKDQGSSGIEALAQGDVELTREIAHRNLRALAELAREGVPIVCSEPSAALMLRQDYLHLLDDVDARTVSERTVELTAFLWDLHRQGRLRTDFQPLDAGIGHHVPCHIKALGSAAGPQLLALIPGLRVHTIDVSCSGMAGSYGLATRNHDASLAAGAPMLRELSRPRALFGATECSSCRLQMEDATGKRTLHPAEYLALAYGLMPEVAERLRQPLAARGAP
jgi:FAD/FMN-containing dehydrogenase/Fe-S oxidoreductase